MITSLRSTTVQIFISFLNSAGTSHEIDEIPGYYGFVTFLLIGYTVFLLRDARNA